MAPKVAIVFVSQQITPPSNIQPRALDIYSSSSSQDVALLSTALFSGASSFVLCV
jgi:hypothetical protein